MAYTPQTWTAREGTKLNKFTKANDTPTTVELVNSPDSVTVAGTPFSAARMNHMETGIFNAHELFAGLYVPHAISSSYAMLGDDKYTDIECDTTSGALTLTLPLIEDYLADSPGRLIRVALVKNDASLDKVIVKPHATDGNKLSSDALTEIWLTKVGDFIVVRYSETSGLWEIVGEKITSCLRLNTYAGFGSSDTVIMRFSNVEKNIGNMFSENHSSGYSSNAKGLEITILRSGRYAFEFGYCSTGVGASNFCFSVDSAQLTTAASAINVSNRRAYAAAAVASGMSIAYTDYFSAGTIIRPHTAGDAPGTASQNDFTVVYLG